MISSRYSDWQVAVGITEDLSLSEVKDEIAAFSPYMDWEVEVTFMLGQVG